MTEPTKATVAGRAFLALRKEARDAGRITAEYLRLYALEGFLLRLVNSRHAGEFVLKGGVLLAAYEFRRPTADIDFSGVHVSNDLESVRQLVVDIASTSLRNCAKHCELWRNTGMLNFRVWMTRSTGMRKSASRGGLPGAESFSSLLACPLTSVTPSALWRPSRTPSWTGPQMTPRSGIRPDALGLKRVKHQIAGLSTPELAVKSGEQLSAQAHSPWLKMARAGTTVDAAKGPAEAVLPGLDCRALSTMENSCRTSPLPV